MSPALLFGCLAALLYGTADFVSRFANRSNGVIPTLFWTQLLLALCATAGLLLIAQWPQGDTGNWAWLLASAAAIGLATACLYTGLAKGRLSVVVPIMASYGAISGILSVVFGEAITPPLASGLGLTVAGAILSGMPSKSSTGGKASGWVYAAGAALLYGFGYWAQGQHVIPVFGPAFMIWATYGLAAIGAGIAALLWRRSVLVLKTRRDIGLTVATAALGGGGFVAITLGQQKGDIAVTAALSSASTAIAVLLALVFLRERPGIRSGCGVAAVIIGTVILNLAG